MTTRRRRGLGIFAILTILFGSLAVGWAVEHTAITLEEALFMALEQNTSHALFLQEQELIEKQEALRKHPQVTASTKPIGMANGKLQSPSGSLTMTMPLGDHLDVTGKVMLEIDKNGVELAPSGSLNLNYSFFALPEEKGGEATAEENRQRQVNSLVLQVVDLLMQLRQQLDLRSYEEGRLRYLEASLEAARLTPEYDDLELKKQHRSQVAKLATMREELEQLQLELVTVLGMPTIASLDPQIGVRDVRQALNEADLYLEALASNLPLRQAQVKVERARDALALERKTRGWDVKASGGLQVNEVTSGLTWNVGLMASKTLYPRNTVIEELELSLAKAEHELSVQENALEGEVRRALQSVTAAENQVELLAEHLAEAREDLDFRHRQYEAGLVTELQVQDTALTLQKAEYDYAVAQMHYAQSILNLWNLCGRDLSQGVFELID